MSEDIPDIFMRRHRRLLIPLSVLTRLQTRFAGAASTLLTEITVSAFSEAEKVVAARLDAQDAEIKTLRDEAAAKDAQIADLTAKLPPPEDAAAQQDVIDRAHAINPPAPVAPVEPAPTPA